MANHPSSNIRYSAPSARSGTAPASFESYLPGETASPKFVISSVSPLLPSNSFTTAVMAPLRSNTTSVHCFVPVSGSTGTITTPCVVENKTVPTFNHAQPISPALPKSPEMSNRPESAALAPVPRWALVEWETECEEPNAYAVIESSQIVETHQDEQTHRKRDSGLYTGKLIQVKRGRYIVPATIVIISEDKGFIDTELQQLRIMAANNLIAKANPQTPTYPRQSQPMRLNYNGQQQSATGEHKTLPRNQFQVPVEQESVHTLKRQRSDSGSFNTKASECRSSTFSEILDGLEIPPPGQMEMSVPSPVRTIAARLDRIDRSVKAAPPMTFDQQTQTIGLSPENTAPLDGHGAKIVSYLESIMAEQKGARMEYEYNRKIMHELHEKLQAQQETFQRIFKAIDEMKGHNKAVVAEADVKGNASVATIPTEVVQNYRAVGTNGNPNASTVSYELSNEKHVLMDNSTGWTTLNRLNRVADPPQDVQSPNPNWSSSVHVAMDDSAIGNNLTSEVTLEEETKVTMDDSILVELEQSYPKETCKDSNSNSITVDELIKNDWNDSTSVEAKKGGQVEVGSGKDTDIDNVETSGGPWCMVPIGSNNTLVATSALDRIKWTNYKSATRMLLLQVFSREELASHSLSGRPSPAYAGVVRPPKSQLNPKVVADIVAIVCKRCGVDEGMVRTVITTKCADENKMLRLRTGVLKYKKPTKKYGRRKVGAKNKENIEKHFPAR